MVSGTITKKKRKRKIYDLFEGHCFWCCNPIVFGRYATLDHVITLRSGGVDALTNYVLACESCNNKRGHMVAYQYLQKFHPYLSINVAIDVMKTLENRMRFHFYNMRNKRRII